MYNKFVFICCHGSVSLWGWVRWPRWGQRSSVCSKRRRGKMTSVARPALHSSTITCPVLILWIFWLGLEGWSTCLTFCSLNWDHLCFFFKPTSPARPRLSWFWQQAPTGVNKTVEDAKLQKVTQRKHESLVLPLFCHFFLCSMSFIGNSLFDMPL